MKPAGSGNFIPQLLPPTFEKNKGLVAVKIEFHMRSYYRFNLLCFFITSRLL